MNAKLKAKWIKALRSGKYQQGGGTLYIDGKFCCLGVLCVVAGASLDELADRGYPEDTERFRNLLPHDEARAFARLNDSSDHSMRVPFEMIAGAIQELL